MMVNKKEGVKILPLLKPLFPGRDQRVFLIAHSLHTIKLNFKINQLLEIVHLLWCPGLDLNHVRVLGHHQLFWVFRQSVNNRAHTLHTNNFKVGWRVKSARLLHFSQVNSTNYPMNCRKLIWVFSGCREICTRILSFSNSIKFRGSR
jgi:hypothetical protein